MLKDAILGERSTIAYRLHCCETIRFQELPVMPKQILKKANCELVILIN